MKRNESGAAHNIVRMDDRKCAHPGERTSLRPSRAAGTTLQEIILDYPEKRSGPDILSAIPDSTLKEVRSYGQVQLHNRFPNMLIHGDNLVALKCLVERECLAGRVQMVYIDPPFSTQQEFRIGTGRTSTVSPSEGDAVAYEDKFKGARFLEFLRERLILLREILAENGSIYLHIDCKIGHYVKIIMDEIFGTDNFINDITRIKCNPKNFSRKGYGNVKDMILFYSKTKKFVWNESRTEMTEEDIIRLFPKIDEDGRRYTTTPLHAPGETKNGATGAKWNGLLPPAGRHWRVPPAELTRLGKQGRIEWSANGNPRKIIYADEVCARGKKMQDMWELKDPPYPSYPTEKNLELLKMIINASSNPGDLVLDCFAGSGTTMVAAEHLGRRWIGIDSSQAAIRTAARRLQEIAAISSYSEYRCSLVVRHLHKTKRNGINR